MGEGEEGGGEGGSGRERERGRGRGRERTPPQIFFMIDADKIIPGGGQRFGRAAPPLVHPVAPEALRLRETSNEGLVRV